MTVTQRRTPGKTARGKRQLAIPALQLVPTPRKRKPSLVLPRYETPMPAHAVDSYGPEVGQWASRTLGVDLMAWQQHVLDRIMAYDADGNLLARTALWSTGRQNGKTIDVRVLIGWIMREGVKRKPFSTWTTLLSCAHDSRQARVVYNQVLADSGGSDLTLTRFAGIRSPDERVTYDVATSQPGSQRGASNGLLSWDEVLTSKDWDLYNALKPTQAAQLSPLMILTSTAGFPYSVVLRFFYDKLVRIAAGDEKPDPAFYGAWWQSEDSAAGLDWDQLAQANPGLLEGRPTKAALQDDFRTMPDAGWSREHLNHWQLTEGITAFRPGVWASNRLAAPLADSDGPYALAIGVAPGWERATIAVAARRQDRRIGAEVYRDFRGEVTPGQITAAIDEFTLEQIPQVISYDASAGGAAAFARHAAESGLPYDGLKPGQMVDAEMDASEMIMASQLAIDDPLVDAQVAGVVRRMVGNAGAFRFAQESTPIDAFRAVALAVHAIAYREQGPRIS